MKSSDHKNRKREQDPLDATFAYLKDMQELPKKYLQLPRELSNEHMAPNRKGMANVRLTARQKGLKVLCQAVARMIFVVVILGQAWAQARNGTSESVDQQLFVLDTSASMSFLSGFRQRITWAQKGIDEYLHTMPKSTRVGLQAFGGCNDTVLLVSVRQGSQDDIRAAFADISPYGGTPLAYALGRSVNALRWDVQGEKVITLVTDGTETCGGDVCRVVDNLKNRYADLRVDVIGFLLDSAAEQELSCLTDRTGGFMVNLKESQLPDFGRILVSFGTSILFRLVALSLGLGAILAWSAMLFRSLHSILKKGVAASMASISGITAAAFLAAILFQPELPFQEYIQLPLLVAAIALLSFLCLFYRDRRNKRAISLLLLLALGTVLFSNSAEGKQLQIQHKTKITSHKGHDHVLAIDISGSMNRFWKRVIAQAKAYVSSHVQDGDTMSLFTFTDKTELVGAWRVEGETDKRDIIKRLDQLRPKPRSYTVFSQLLPVIVSQLRAVAHANHEQAVLIFSDGKQSHPPGFQGTDIPFRSIGERIFRGQGYLIAGVGEVAFDPLASKLPLASIRSNSDSAILKEWRSAFSPRLTLESRHLVIEVSPSLIGQRPSQTPFLLSLSSTSVLPKETDLTASLVSSAESLIMPSPHLSLQGGKGTIKGSIPIDEFDKELVHGTLSLTLPENFSPTTLSVPIKIRFVPWIERHSIVVWSLGAFLFILCSAFLFRYMSRSFRVIWLTTGNGEALPLSFAGVLPVGSGGIGPEDFPEIGQLVRAGKRLFLESTSYNGTGLQVNGMPIVGRVPYRLGSPITCIAHGKEEQIVLRKTTKPRASTSIEYNSNLLDDDLL